MRVRSLWVSAGAAAVAAAGLMAVPTGVAQAAACTSGFDANADGIQDTAIGAPFEDAPAKNAGSVTVVYGRAANSFGGGSMMFTEKQVGGTPQSGDEFGAALAIGDVNGDTCYDLVVGVPGKNHRQGRIVVILGSTSGLDLSSAKWISESTSGMPSKAEDGDQFGASLAFSGPNFQYLWAGAPGENVGKANGAGAVVRFTTSTTGSGNLPVPGSKQYYQGGGAPGTAENGDRFGEILSGSEHSLLVGDPKEDVGDAVDAGIVYAYTDSWLTFQQDTTTPWAVPTSAYKGDRFGQAVAQVPSCSGNASDEAYVVAAPGENLTGAVNAGQVSVLDRGTSAALSLTQASLGGTPEGGDAFGRRLAALGTLLVASAPEEDLGSGKSGENRGVINQGVLGCDGTTPAVTSSVQLSQDSADVSGTGAKGDRFGRELAFSWSSATPPALLVGAPLKADGNVIDGGRVVVFSQQAAGLFVGAGSTSFGQSSADIAGTAEKGDQFGSVIASNAG